MWIDFQGIRDEFMRAHGSDYFQNTRHATFVRQEYAIRNPMNFVGSRRTISASIKGRPS